MRNNIRQLLSIPSTGHCNNGFISTANVDAQCPGGCFGYPTPSRPADSVLTRQWPQYTQYRPAVEVFQPQTFVQEQPFVSAPQFAPIESYAPMQPFAPLQFAQPQYIQPEIIQPQFVQPNLQTFASQPAIAAPIYTVDTPQYFPQTSLPVLPVDNYYPPQAAIISPGQIAQPMIWNSINPVVSPSFDSGVAAEMNGELQNGKTANSKTASSKTVNSKMA